MSAPPPPSSSVIPPDASKVAFVTVGASASFKALIEEVLSAPFLARLEALGFSHLVVQCGPDYDWFASAKRFSSSSKPGLAVTGFAYDQDLREYMRLAAPRAAPVGGRGRERGLIITHAGSGSILEALDYDAAIIAVPNPALMDNHQSEIAEEMADQGFLVQGKVGSLASVLNEDLLKAPKKRWPPPPDQNCVWQGGLWDIVGALMPTPKTKA